MAKHTQTIRQIVKKMFFFSGLPLVKFTFSLKKFYRNFRK